MSFFLSKHDLQKIVGLNRFNLICLIGKFAETKGINCFLVGGVVRDAVLGIGNKDIDFLVEGDGIKFSLEVKEFFKEKNYRIISSNSFKKYKTSKISLVYEEEELGLDFSSSRTEIYESPGASPIVEKGTLYEDSKRRDFSINSMSMHIGEENFGLINDFFNGLRDIKERKIRILHPFSFRDDGARLIRAVRFMVRFNFFLEEDLTKKCFKEGVSAGYLNFLKPFRLLDEFKKAFREEKNLDILKELDKLGLISSLLTFLPKEASSKNLDIIYNSKEHFNEELWRLVISNMCVNCDKDELFTALKSFNMSKKDIVKIVRY